MNKINIYLYQTEPRDCTEHYDKGARSNGVYRIYPNGIEMRVYCELESTPSDGSGSGGWLVFQRRVDSTVDFYRLYIIDRINLY